MRPEPSEAIAERSRHTSEETSREPVSAYERAAASGDHSAMNELGVIYLEGTMVERNEALGLAWLARAADAGLPLAQRNMGFAYEHGRAVPEDLDVAAKWYARAVSAGHVRASVDLGRVRRKLADAAN
jgi:TPR repeat protein